VSELSTAAGANANPATGSGGPKNNRDLKKARTPPLEVPVPPGGALRRCAAAPLPDA
jgi:hypothetical protein